VIISLFRMPTASCLLQVADRASNLIVGGRPRANRATDPESPSGYVAVLWPEAEQEDRAQVTASLIVNCAR
jgi:hypothetical protein